MNRLAMSCRCFFPNQLEVMRSCLGKCLIDSGLKTNVCFSNFCFSSYSVVDPIIRQSVVDDQTIRSVKGCAGRFHVKPADSLSDDVADSSLAVQSEDSSVIVPRCVQQSFNIAPFVRGSPTLSQLVALGVDVSRWEKDPELLRMVALLDFGRDVAPLVKWLLTVGFPVEQLAPLLTKNPYLMKEHIGNLQSRCQYLKWKRFSSREIKSILTGSPFWLSKSIEEIDGRLGYFQKRFCLSSPQLRQVCSRYPRLFLWCLKKVEVNRFTACEEFGLSNDEARSMLIAQPKAMMLSREALVDRLDLLLFRMQLSPQRLIESESQLLLYRPCRLRPRHLFLQTLQRDQYDPLLPGFVKPAQLVLLDDRQFCQTLAHVPLLTYQRFLKSL